jgi:hypothetical protein
MSAAERIAAHADIARASLAALVSAVRRLEHDRRHGFPDDEDTRCDAAAALSRLLRMTRSIHEGARGLFGTLPVVRDGDDGGRGAGLEERACDED